MAFCSPHISSPLLLALSPSLSLSLFFPLPLHSAFRAPQEPQTASSAIDWALPVTAFPAVYVRARASDKLSLWSLCVCSLLCSWASEGLENLCVILSNYLNARLFWGKILTRCMCTYIFGLVFLTLCTCSDTFSLGAHMDTANSRQLCASYFYYATQ